MYEKKPTKSMREANPKGSHLHQAVPTSACGYKFHPLANIFPLMAPKQLAALIADIQARGLLEPIWIYEHMILDGRNRALACEILGIKPETRQWPGPGSPLDFVVSTNVVRRHLSTSQRALVAAGLKPLYEEEARQRMLAGKASDPAANLPQGRARDLAAKVMGVSAKTVEFATRVKEKGVPALVARVEADKCKVSTAAAIAERPADEQIEILTGDPAAVRKKVKSLLDARKSKIKPKGKGNGKAADLVSEDSKPLDSSAPAVLESPDGLAGRLTEQVGIEWAREYLSKALEALGKLNQTGEQSVPKAPVTVSSDSGNDHAPTTAPTETVPAANGKKRQSTDKKSKTARARKS